jgi:FK506-binding nuclear protein
VSKACIEPQSAGKGTTSIYVEADDEEFLICNLNASETNVTLDLNFNDGEKICFRSSGAGTVHLTGYNVPEDEGGMDMSNFDMESDGEEEDDEVPQLVKAFSKGKKPDMATDAELKAAIKKAKVMQAKIAAESKKSPKGAQGDEAESSDDEDYDEDDEDEMGSEEEEEDDDEDGEDDEDDSDDEKKVEASSPSPKKKQMNGDSTKKKDKKKDKTPVKQDKQNGDKPSKENKTPNKPDQKTPKKTADTPKAVKTPKKQLKGGVVVESLSVGNGPEAKRGKMIGMYYEGKLKSNNKKFDATLTGKPFKFRLGAGEVIKGWDVGLGKITTFKFIPISIYYEPFFVF